MSKEAEQATRDEDYEKAQSLLVIVYEVDPSDEAARKKKCEVDGKVLLKQFSQALETGSATRSMSMLADFSESDCFQKIKSALQDSAAYPFEDPKNAAAKVGDAVAAKVVQHIFSTIPSDVRIVEREQLERILDECKRTKNCNELTTADFIVQGSINDAKVETTEKTGSETRRVLTGKEIVPNPEHAAWIALKERERKKTPEPPATIPRDITEDVKFDVTAVLKVGIISVSYRVVEASSGRVVFTDSLQDRQEFRDEGRQGVQLGDFKQETDFVELPPDIEILSGDKGLADKISDAIGKKLVEFLQNPEEQYEQDASRAVEEGDFAEAARKVAYAIALRESKSKDVGRLRELLRSYAMQSPRY